MTGEITEQVTVDLRKKFWNVIKEQGGYLLEMKNYLFLIGLGVICRQNVFVIGDVGMAKSLGAVDWAKRLNLPENEIFLRLLSKSLPDTEIFGVPSVKAMLEEESPSRNIEGMLPTCKIAVFDELGKASDNIRNTLLEAFCEHTYSHGKEKIAIPLRCAIGTSNEELPDTMRAFDDRLLLRIKMDGIKCRDNWKLLMDGATLRSRVSRKCTMTMDEIDTIYQEAMKLQFPTNVLDKILDIKDGLEKQGMLPSQRRFTQASDVIRVYAYLNGHAQVQIGDLDILRYILWQKTMDIETVSTVVNDVANPLMGDIVKYRNQFELWLKEVVDIRTKIEEQDRKIQEQQAMNGGAGSVSGADYIAPKELTNKWYDVDQKMIRALKKLKPMIERAKADGYDVTEYTENYNVLLDLQTKVKQTCSSFADVGDLKLDLGFE